MSKNYKNCCCNPFYDHKKIILKSLRPIPKHIFDNIAIELGIPSNGSVCTACLKKLQKQCLSGEENEVDASDKDSISIGQEDDEFQDESANQHAVNTVLSELGVSPIKLRKYILKNIFGLTLNN